MILGIKVSINNYFEKKTKIAILQEQLEGKLSLEGNLSLKFGMALGKANQYIFLILTEYSQNIPCAGYDKKQKI